MKSNLGSKTAVQIDYTSEEFKEAVSAIIQEETTEMAKADLCNVESHHVAGKASEIISPLYSVSFKFHQEYGSVQTPYRGIDGLFIIPYDSVIEKVTMYNLKAGLGGATEIDVKLSNEGVFESIFDITPRIQATVGDNSFVMTNKGKKGLIAPVVIEGLILKEGEALRADLLAKQSGNPANCGMTIFLRKL